MTLNSSAIDEADAMLIERVRQTSCLYNTDTTDFKLSHKKERAWEELAETLGISVIDAKRRWTCLRDRYSRELRLLRGRVDKRDDYGRSEFFRLMDFLRPFVKKRNARKNPWEHGSINSKILKTSENESYEDGTHDHYGSKLENVGNDEYNFVTCELDPIESYEHYNVDVEGSSIGKQTKNLKTEALPIMVPHLPPDIGSGDISQHQVKMEPKLLQQFSQQQETEDDFFCKSVAMYLRKLTRRHKIKAKVEIFQILEKYIEIEESSSMNTTNQYNRNKP